ncbi:hypothetical protein OIO90_001088 [Microbotryomycetes sp. JL221]|nr:hypothetical protein OIO90_001088 [Microbotryomycetes sp. JL221]
MIVDDDDSPWLDDDRDNQQTFPSQGIVGNAHDDVVARQEWTKMSTKFTDAGYRDGITAGKNSQLQRGFDQGFGLAAVHARRVGILRGIATTLLNMLTASNTSSTLGFGTSASSTASSSTKAAQVWVKQTFDHKEDGSNDNRRDKSVVIQSLRSIVERLSKLDEQKVVPPDLEAIEHAKSHAAEAQANGRDEDDHLSKDMYDKKEIGQLEDMMGSLGRNSDGGSDGAVANAATTTEADNVEACARDLALAVNACGLDGTRIVPRFPS